MSTTLAIQPGDFDAAMKFAEALCRSTVCPQHLKGKPIDAAMIILWGAEAGIGPMQAVYGINVIQGNPDASPELMRALIGRAGHKLEVVRLDDRGCELRLTRADTGAVIDISFTEEDAKRASLLGKGQWKSYPKAMYLARATSMLGRAGAADVVAGLSYTHEEVTSFAGDGAAPLRPDEFPDPLAAEAAVAEAAAVPLANDEQRAAIADLCKELGLTATAYADTIEKGYGVRKTAALTEEEADEVIARLDTAALAKRDDVVTRAEGRPGKKSELTEAIEAAGQETEDFDDPLSDPTGPPPGADADPFAIDGEGE